MGCNNQGIMHLATRPGGMPVCRNVKAHMSTTEDRFDLEGMHQCKRCAAVLAKWKAKRAVKEAARVAAVDKEIAKDPSIGPGEAKAIHALLKGWR